MKYLITFVITLMLSLAGVAILRAEDHGDHEKKHAHGEKDEHGGSVGPDKGILEASVDGAIRISPEALRNFELKTIRLAGSGPWTLPPSAKLQSLEEENVYRLRNGFYKRVEFVVSKRTASEMTIGADNLKAGDEVVISGIGFLRIAEIAAFGGAPEGHSH
jgi:hypothetical protein